MSNILDIFLSICDFIEYDSFHLPYEWEVILYF
jgi:hypothetical protein